MPKRKKSTELHFVLIGGKGVGKYSLREQFIKGWIAPKDFEAPPGPSTKILVLDKKTVEVTITILGELKSEDDDLKNCHGIVLLYNISDKSSMEYIRNDVVPFLQSVLVDSEHTSVDTGEGTTSTLMDRALLLVGNKADEAKLSRNVPSEDGTAFSEEIKCCGFFETSATCNENVRKAFECLVATVLEKSSLLNPPQDKKKRSNCSIL